MSKALRFLLVILICCVVVQLAEPVNADQIQLVKQIGTATASSDPFLFDGFFVADDHLFFTAEGSGVGHELWCTDGTEEGTVLLELVPGPGDPTSVLLSRSVGPIDGVVFLLVQVAGRSGPTDLFASDGTSDGTKLLAGGVSGSLAALGDDLFFSVESDLWVSDGTPDGTELFREFDGTPAGFAEFAGELYFSADDGEGFELWKTDGTVAGTRLVSDVVSGDASSYATPVATVDGELLFTTFAATLIDEEEDEFDRVTELWTTDGTDDGTSFVVEIGEDPEFVAELDGVHLFWVYTADEEIELWRTDGTDDGTELLTDFSTEVPPDSFTAFDDSLWFRAGEDGDELWRSDGTPGGTELIETFERISPREPAFSVTSLGLFFWASTGSTGWEPWILEAGEEEPTMVADITPDEGSSRPAFWPGSFVELDDQVYFLARGEDEGTEIWVTDGTADGTTPALDEPFSGASDSYMNNLTLVGDRIVFSAQTSDVGYEPRVFDGKSIELLGDLNETLGSGRVGPLVALDDERFLFLGREAMTGEELWISDGTAAGTTLLQDIAEGEQSSYVRNFVRVGQLVYFVANSVDAEGNLSVSELWTTDGTEDGTERVVEISPYGGSIGTHYLLAFGEQVVFLAETEDDGGELWISDGTAAGTEMVLDLMPGSQGSRTRPMAVLGESVLFTARTEETGIELWKTDGTADGTELILDINEGEESSWPSHFVEYDGEWYFRAETADEGTELWKTDGTEEGTVLVADFFEGPDSSGPVPLAVVSDQLFLTTELGGGALRVIDGATVRDLGSLTFVSLGVRSYGAFDDQFFFTSWDADDGRELWKSDGQNDASTTLQVKDINPDEPSSFPRHFFAHRDFLYFSAITEDHGRELWRTAGTGATTELVEDLADGEASSWPQHFLELAGTLYFTAEDAVLGRQLYKVVPGSEFLRGDANSNGSVDALPDALFLLRWNFAGGEEPPCMDAADCNDSGTVSAIPDALFLLRWGFEDGAAPPAPGTDECGVDPLDGEPDETECDEVSKACD